MKHYHLIYKTTNTLNGKFYIGMHSTDDINDGYLGSGVALSKAIKKYGREFFSKEILFIFDNVNDMVSKECEIVTQNLIEDANTYNIALGGQGGNLGDLVNAKIGQKMSKILKNKSKSDSHKQALRIANQFYKPTDQTKQKISKTIRHTWCLMSAEERKNKCGFAGTSNPFYGRRHSDESKVKIKNTIGCSRKGSLNANAKPITLNGVTYPTRKECMETLNLSKRQLYKLLGEQ